MRWPWMLVLLSAVSGCAAVVAGPSRLAGQDLDAAVALYGQWSEEATIGGETNYIWRRTLIVDGNPKVCELRVTLGFRTTIRSASMQGQPDACRLYAVRTENLTN